MEIMLFSSYGIILPYLCHSVPRRLSRIICSCGDRLNARPAKGHSTLLLLTYWPLGNLNEILDMWFQTNLVIDGWGICCEIALIWMSLDFNDDQSTLVQLMAWCRQATSYYLSQGWPRSLSPSGVTWPQWVNAILVYVWTNSRLS